MIEIDVNRFYKIGIICFSIIAVMNIADFIIKAPIHNVFSGIAAIMGIVFNMCLVLFFVYLYRQQNPQIEEVAASEDIDEIIKEVRENGRNSNRKPLKSISRAKGTHRH